MMREQCPVCGASDLEELIALDDYPLGGNGVVRDEVHADVPTGTLVIGSCRVCGMTFQLDPVSSEQLDEMLFRQPVPVHPRETGMEVAETDRFVAALQKYGPSKGKVLDIGCGTGVLLESLAKLGFEVSGIDANPAVLEHLKESDFDVKGGRFEEGIYPDETFDLIVCRSVLDHAIEPGTLLSSISNVLKPGGVLAIEVPNAGRIFKRSAFGGFTFHHVSYWSSPTLKYALTLEGMEILGGFEESYIAMFAQKAEKGEDETDPLPPSGEWVDEVFDDLDKFLERKERLAEALPDLIRDKFPKGVTIVGAGPPTIDLLYYTGLEDEVKHVLSTDSARHGAYLAGSDRKIETLYTHDDEAIDAMIISSERRVEELIDRLSDFRADGGQVVRFSPEMHII